MDLTCKLFGGRDNNGGYMMSFRRFVLSQDPVNEREEERKSFSATGNCLLIISKPVSYMLVFEEEVF